MNDFTVAVILVEAEYDHHAEDFFQEYAIQNSITRKTVLSIALSGIVATLSKPIQHFIGGLAFLFLVLVILFQE